MRAFVMNSSKIRSILGKLLLICLLGTLLVFCVVGIWMFKYQAVFYGDLADIKHTQADDYDADDVDHIVPIVSGHLPDLVGMETSTINKDGKTLNENVVANTLVVNWYTLIYSNNYVTCMLRTSCM